MSSYAENIPNPKTKPKKQAELAWPASEVGYRLMAVTLTGKKKPVPTGTLRNAVLATDLAAEMTAHKPKGYHIEVVKVSIDCIFDSRQPDRVPPVTEVSVVRAQHKEEQNPVYEHIVVTNHQDPTLNGVWYRKDA